MKSKVPNSDIKKRIIQGFAIAGGSYLTYHFGKKAYDKWKQKSTSALADKSPAVRQAMSLRSAINPSGTSWLKWSDGTNETSITQTASQIINLEAVINAYRNLYNSELLSDLQSELSTNEFNAFLQTIANNKINSSNGNGTSSSNSTGTYTQPQNIVVAKQAVYVRTSPDASYHGAWYEVTGNKNIFKTAKAGEFVGYASGKQHYDSENNVKFIEVSYRNVNSGETKILWISASSNYTEQFSSVASMEAKYPLTKGITSKFLAINGLGLLTDSGSRAISICKTEIKDKNFKPITEIEPHVLIGFPVMSMKGNGMDYTLIRTVDDDEVWVKSSNIITG